MSVMDTLSHTHYFIKWNLYWYHTLKINLHKVVNTEIQPNVREMTKKRVFLTFCIKK